MLVHSPKCLRMKYARLRATKRCSKGESSPVILLTLCHHLHMWQIVRHRIPACIARYIKSVSSAATKNRSSMGPTLSMTSRLISVHAKGENLTGFASLNCPRSISLIPKWIERNEEVLAKCPSRAPNYVLRFGIIDHGYGHTAVVFDDPAKQPFDEVGAKEHIVI